MPKVDTYSDAAIKLVKSLEGFRSTAYCDIGGKLTIGYGETAGVLSGDTITEAKANELLVARLNDIADTLNRLVKVPLSQNQFDALCSFVYNIGSGAFANSSLLSLLNLGCYETVPHQLFRWKWVTRNSVHSESEGLLARRHKEADLWISARK